MAILDRKALSDKLQNTKDGDELEKRQKIDLFNCKFTQIDLNTFQGLDQLEVLILSNNSISEIGENIFESVANLKELNLEANKLKCISSSVFKGLIHLETLSLQENQIEEIKTNTFEYLSSLKELHLENNKLRRLDYKAFGGLVQLEILGISENELVDIEENAFEGLTNLKYLFLFKNRLELLHPKTSGLINLERLEINNNELNELDDDLFEDLGNLKFLSLNINKLKRIDKNLFRCLRKLERLSLRDNGIEEFHPLAFENTKNLKYLYIWNNKVKYFYPESFKPLEKLEILWMYSNQLDQIELDWFTNLVNLNVLKLDNNKIKRIDPNIFNRLAKLTLLLLNENEIEILTPESFNGLRNLRELNLSNNNLNEICGNAFKDLLSLETLILSGNRLVTIDSDAFNNLSNLKVLKLNENKLQRIDPLCINPLKSIAIIQLFDNDLDLHYLSFYNKSAGISTKEDSKLIEKGFLSDINQFIQQFDESGSEIDDPYIGKIFIERYEIKKQLGKGSYGNVYLVFDLEVKQNKAMKIIEGQSKKIENEIKILWKVDNENIIRYFDHFELRISNWSTICIITEYCENGDLKQKIREKMLSGKGFEKRQIIKWMLQATNALDYLHKEKIIHRDIKPENMLLTKQNVIKLADLGIAKLIESTNGKTWTGTENYMSPEIFKLQFENIYYYPNTDIWSLGCVLYELIFLKMAFPDGQRNNPPLPSDINSSPLFSSILIKMLEKDPIIRIDASKLYDEFESIQNI